MSVSIRDQFGDVPLEDLIPIAAIPSMLIGVYYLLPLATQTALALDHQDPSLWSWWTYVLVHEHIAGDAHLWENVIGYLTVVIPSWIIVVSHGKRRQFWLSTLAVLVLGPPVLALLSSSVFGAIGLQTHFSKGFSGIVCGLSGVFFGTVLTILDERNRPEMRTVLWFLLLVFFATAAGMGSSTISGVLSLLAAVAIFVGYGIGRTTGVFTALVDTLLWTINDPRNVILVASWLIVTTLIIGTLEQPVISHGSVIDIVAHGGGVILGLIVIYGISHLLYRDYRTPNLIE